MVRAGASLPANVRYQRLLLRSLLDGNILDEEPQHALAVLRLRGGGMPDARQILGEREDLRVLLGGGDTGFSTQTVSGLVSHLLHL